MTPKRNYLFLFALLVLPAFAGVPVEALASVSVGVNINLGPPVIVAAEPPTMVVVPQSNVYYVPEPGIDIFFYAGFWWSPRGDYWYQSRNYNHGWVAVAPSRVPRAVIYMPRDYRTRYAHEQRIPYGHWKNNYSIWEKERATSHMMWEKEREKEWKKAAQHNRYGEYGNKHPNVRGGVHSTRSTSSPGPVPVHGPAPAKSPPPGPAKSPGPAPAKSPGPGPVKSPGPGPDRHGKR